MRSLGIFAAPYKPQASEMAARLVQLAAAHDIEARLQAGCARSLGRDDLAADDAIVAACDVLITLSGDGGVLGAARAAAPYGTPILAVDLGRLGFLSSVRPNDLDGAFEMLRCGEFAVEERMMLDAQVLRQGSGSRVSGLENDGSTSQAKSPASPNPEPETRNPVVVVGGSIGLNDAVVAKSALARILRLSISVAGQRVADVRADGFVVSTPTGSTAYALSAGGPIVHPDVPLLLLCPICAHSLALRPLVVGPDETVEILAEWEGEEVESSALEAMLTIDGQVGVRLQSGDVVRVCRAPATAHLLRLPTDSFYARLREKMRWGH